RPRSRSAWRGARSPTCRRPLVATWQRTARPWSRRATRSWRRSRKRLRKWASRSASTCGEVTMITFETKLDRALSNSGVDTRIWHVARIWPGTFAVIGAIDTNEAKGFGFKAGNLTGDDPDDSNMMDAMGEPHPMLVDIINELPDDAWV